MDNTYQQAKFNARSYSVGVESNLLLSPPGGTPAGAQLIQCGQ